MKLSWLAHKLLVWVETSSKLKKIHSRKTQCTGKVQILMMSNVHHFSRPLPQLLWTLSFLFLLPCVLPTLCFGKLKDSSRCLSMILDNPLKSNNTYKKTANIVTVSSLGQRWSNKSERFIDACIMCLWVSEQRKLTTDIVKSCN